MTRSTGSRSVDRIVTETEADSERAPLLAGTPTPITASRSPSYGDEPTATDPLNPDDNNNVEENEEDDENDPLTHLRRLLRPRVILLAVVLLFLLEIAAGSQTAPLNAVMEAIICRQMHPDVFLSPPNTTIPAIPIPSPGLNLTAATAGSTVRHFAGGLVLSDDPLCKGPDVQGHLAMLRGWQATFESVPGLIMAVPYGILSDRWGRRPVLGLGLFGIVLMFVWSYAVFFFSDFVPLWVMLFGAAFMLIGGGGQVVVAMVFTTIADVVPAEARATVFFQLTAVFLGSQMIAGPLGGAMMVWNPWVPLLFSLAVMVISNLFVLAFPETVHVHDRNNTRGDRDADEDDTPGMAKLLQKARAGLAEVWAFVLGNQRLAFLMVSLVFVMLGRFVGEVLLQYATKRYHWSWSYASMVLTIRSAGSLVTLLVLLPVASWLCVKRLGMSGMAKDLTLARWSGIVQVLGCLLIAAAANGAFFSFGLAWFALGAGMSSVIRSLLNALVEEHHVGTVNSLIGFMETGGMIIAGPLLAKSLSVGMNLGGAWVGLPFVTAGLFFSISTTILWAFRLPNRRRSSVEPSC